MRPLTLVRALREQAALMVDDHGGGTEGHGFNAPFKLHSRVYRGEHEGAERLYNASNPARAFHSGLEFASHRWLFVEGHMRCVWAMAERVARIIAADQVRVDVFVAKGRPTSCMVNEISLSSGSPLGADGSYAARLWIRPLLHPQGVTAIPGEVPQVYRCKGEGCGQGPPARLAVSSVEDGSNDRQNKSSSSAWTRAWLDAHQKQDRTTHRLA